MSVKHTLKQPLDDKHDCLALILRNMFLPGWLNNIVQYFILFMGYNK